MKQPRSRITDLGHCRNPAASQLRPSHDWIQSFLHSSNSVPFHRTPSDNTRRAFQMPSAASSHPSRRTTRQLALLDAKCSRSPLTSFSVSSPVSSTQLIRDRFVRLPPVMTVNEPTLRGRRFHKAAGLFLDGRAGEGVLCCFCVAHRSATSQRTAGL